MTPVPQLLRSFAVPRREPLEQLPGVRKAIRQVESELGDEGRVLVRWSGTENKLRVMVECLDASRLEEYVGRIQARALKELGG